MFRSSFRDVRFTIEFGVVGFVGLAQGCFGLSRSERERRAIEQMGQRRRLGSSRFLQLLTFTNRVQWQAFDRGALLCHANTFHTPYEQLVHFVLMVPSASVALFADG